MGASTRTTTAQRPHAAQREGARKRRAAPEGDGALRYLVDFIDAFMWQADPDDLQMSFVTRSVQDVLGCAVADWIGGPDRWGEWIHPEDRERVIEELRAAAADGNDHEIEFRAEASNGRTVWLRHAVRTVTSPSGHSELWGLTTDVTAAKQAENALRLTARWNRALSAQAERFRQQALHDALTSLPNRILFDDRLGQALREAQRRNAECSVLLIDLNGFKQINDSLGHQAGDAVLREVAVRLRIVLRKSDTAARVGGDEFAAVLPETGAQGAVQMARRMTHAMRDAPFVVEGRSLDVGASIGIATFPVHGNDESELVARADEAMYRAKAGRRGHVLYNAKRRVPSIARQAMDRSRMGSAALKTPGAKRWILLAAAALLGLSSWAVAAGDHRPERVKPAAVRLDMATETLAHASPQSSVEDIIETTRQTLVDVRWEEVGTKEFQTSLTKLRTWLDRIRSQVPVSLRDDVRRLTVEVQQVQAAADLKIGPTPAATPQLPRG